MLEPGDTFERYTIDSVLGQGGMGTVYRALDTRLQRRVALKVIAEGQTSQEADARLLREARAAAALDHPNAVSIFDVGEVDGEPYIVMELVSGRTLRDAVSSSVPVTVRIGWLADVGRALSAAHKRGLVHRDIKPENVMVRDDGVVKVLDFGIARRARSDVDPTGPTQGPALPTLTKEGIKIGTPLYMAPEQIRGDSLDGRADEFSWAVLAYEILAGELPWRNPGDPLAVVASILTDEPREEPLEAAGVPADVRAVVLRALSRRPDDRFATMEEAVRALESAAKGRDDAAAPSGERSRAAPLIPAETAAKSPGTTTLQRFSTAEVRDILSRAVDQEAAKEDDARLGFDDLVAAAREVGVEENTLREATRELRARAEVRTQDAGFEAWRRRRRRGFFRHLGVYLIVNAAFFVLGFLTGSLFGTMQPALWWGIGLGIHGLRAFTAHEDDYHHTLEHRARRERRKQARELAVNKAIEEGAAALRSTGALIRKRIEAATGQLPGRMRIAPPPERPTPPAKGPTTDEAVEIAAEVEREIARELGRSGRRAARRHARRDEKKR